MLQLTSARRAFTALELLVAMAIGLVIAGTMFAAFRAVASTASVVARMSKENQALRSGLIAACEQNVDFWIDADDPLGDPGDPRPDHLRNILPNVWNANLWNQTDPTRAIDGNGGQGLRGFDVERTGVRHHWVTGSKQGLPFTPFEWLRDLTEFNDSTLRIFDPVVGTEGTEDEAGWRRDQHWAAADERTWYHGDAGVHWPTRAASSPNPGTVQAERRLQFGRYAIVSSPYRTVDLPAGFTERDFGTIAVRRSWRDRKLLSMLNALGFFGAVEYLPKNTIWSTLGAELLHSSGETMHSQNRMVGPLSPSSMEAPTPCWFFVGTISGGGGTLVYGLPGYVASPSEMYWGGQILNLGIYPPSVYARDPFYPDGNAHTYHLGEGTNPRRKAKNHAQVRTTGLIASGLDNAYRVNHSGPIYHGPLGNYEGRDWEKVQMTIAKRPLLIQRPADWPEVLVGTSRVMWGGKFMNTCQVRWSDPVSGRFQSISFNAFGTTLRGARQQRKLPTSYTDVGGWARWREPWDLRRQRKLAPVPHSTDPWVEVPNDRCLDDFVDPTDPEFRP